MTGVICVTVPTIFGHDRRFLNEFLGSLEKIIEILQYHNSLILAIDFPGGKRNRNIKIRAQLRILKCIAIVKEASQNVLKHFY